MTNKSAFRVGMIGCGNRGLWYGAVFDRIDPRAYAELAPFEYHHMTLYNRVTLCIRKAAGMRLTRVYDADRHVAESLRRAFGNRPVVCDSIESVSDDVDIVFIANESGDGSDHPRLAAPGLRKGLPTFIDRPLAASVKEARALIALARRRGAPLLSCSHVAMMPHVARFKRRFDEMDDLELGMVQGIGPNPAWVCDGADLAIETFGDLFGGKVHDVRSMGQWPLDVGLIHFKKPRSGRSVQVMLHTGHSGTAHRAFFARATSHRLPLDAPDLEMFRQAEGGRVVVEMVRDMARTGRPPLTPARMIEPVAVMEAARKSHNSKRAAPLSRVRSG